MIAGLNSITKGELSFNKRRVNDLLPNERDIAFVFQSYALYPHMNVFANMAFSLKMARVPKQNIQRRVEDVAKILNISHVLNSRPAELSGGQRQRVALGRALVRKPAIFLMDEPLSNLDAKLRESMRTEIVSLHNALGTTTVYVTHDQLEAMTMATRIVLMNAGSIQQIGTPTELYEKPANLFTARFIGTPTINVIEGTIDDQRNFVSTASDLRFPLNRMELQPGRAITVALRPEDLVIVEESKKTNLQVRVVSNELLGKERELKAVTSAGTRLTITTSRLQNLSIDQEIGLNFTHYHLFDAITGTRIE
ncbi:unnamed protein product [Didymodactylos carnosus]|uniref:ABC transporter domain-containing protein n=1 Tax=Didymodactylos carnosus TaxID=1234261 RepID=A0A8S2CVC8_9BILA|nr:unnamed protein product [Didymodactylos carnosus]CAF3565348.1 unnamed protein product [Didymodactylos carnosus]